MALVPGLPPIPFLLLAAGTGLRGHIAGRAKKGDAKETSPPVKSTLPKAPVEDLLDIDRVSVQVGLRLISMVDPNKESTIFDRIGALRRRFAQELGIIVPLVRLRDNINLQPNTYEIRLFDHAIATGQLEPNMLLAMDSGSTQVKLEGIETTEPVYGLPALWIQEADREKAELSGYTVIDPESVFITHLSETLKKHAQELITREDVQLLVDRVGGTQPSLVRDVVGELVSVGMLQRILKNLLSHGIPVRELATILESLGEHAGKTKNPDILTEMVRKDLKRTITDLYRNEQGKILAITLDPNLEYQMLNQSRQEGDRLNLTLDTETTMAFSRQVAQVWKRATDKGHDNMVLLCDSRLRHNLAAMLARVISTLPVIAYDEIVIGTDIEPIDTVCLDKNQELNQNRKAMAMSS
jgi:flagellar biosynthesis protein FlhA